MRVIIEPLLCYRRRKGVRGLMVLCIACSCSVPISADKWADEVRLSDLEPQFVCQASRRRCQAGFDWDNTHE